MNERTAANIRRGKHPKLKKALIIAALVALALVLTSCVAENDTSSDGFLSGILGEELARSESVSIVVLLTILSLLPSILIMLTGFTRIIIVLSLIRNAIGLQQMPPNQVLVGLALFLTFFIMAPVIGQINEQAYQPYVRQEISVDEAIDSAVVPLREFMIGQTYTDDLNFFTRAASARSEQELVFEEYSDIPMSVAIPAFITSEIKRGFQIGFYIYLPFIVVDMIVASTLMSMGMMMLPPIVISLPFKLLLFVLVDGWMLTIKTLLDSFG